MNVLRRSVETAAQTRHSSTFIRWWFSNTEQPFDNLNPFGRTRTQHSPAEGNFWQLELFLAEYYIAGSTGDEVMRHLSVILMLMATPALADNGRYKVLKDLTGGVYLVLDTVTGGTKICVGKVSDETCVAYSRGGDR
jgi:hypothetical protein